MNSSLFDVLHDGTDHHLVAVRDTIDIDFDGLIQESVQQNRGVITGDHGIAQIAL